MAPCAFLRVGARGLNPNLTICKSLFHVFRRFAVEPYHTYPDWRGKFKAQSIAFFAPIYEFSRTLLPPLSDSAVFAVT